MTTPQNLDQFDSSTDLSKPQQTSKIKEPEIPYSETPIAVDEFGITAEHQKISDEEIRAHLQASQQQIPDVPFSFKHYQMIEQVDQGGTALVYRGINMDTQANIAFKVLKSQFQDQLEYIHAFLDQAKILQTFRAPYFVSVLDYGESPWGVWMVMEWIDGLSLDLLINSFAVSSSMASIFEIFSGVD